MTKKRWAFLFCFCAAMFIAAGAVWPSNNAVQTLVRTIGPFPIHARALGQMGPKEEITFPEAVWVVSYKTEVLDSNGNSLPNFINCHSMFQKFIDDGRKYASLDTYPFRGIYSDGYMMQLSLPEGFGVFFDKDEPVSFMPMFNNRAEEDYRPTVRVTIGYIPAKDLKTPLKPLYGTIQSVHNPHFYAVQPGPDQREVSFRFPYDGTIHLLAVHVHPYGKEVELFNQTKNEVVWKGVGTRNDEGKLIQMPHYESTEGYEFHNTEKYVLRVSYDNPTTKIQDAMGGLFILFSTKDDQPPVGNLPILDMQKMDHSHDMIH